MRIGQVLSALSTTVLTLCAVTVTALVVRHDLFPASARARASRTERVADWRRYAASGHRTGPATAPVSLVVFSDFQCPACRVLAGSLTALHAEFPDQLAIVHRHAPLRIHPYAVAAALASECAARQDRFDAFHDALFADQGSIGLQPWSRFASNAGVRDLKAFDACVAAPGPQTALLRDTLEARSLKLTGTPTLLVNGTLLRGVPPLDTLRAYVRRAAAEARSAGLARTASATR